MFKWSYALMLTAAVSVASLSSCGDNAEKKAEKRVADLGFVANLPQDAGFVVGFYDTNELWQKLRNSPLARTVFNMNEADGKNLAPEQLLAAIPAHPMETLVQNIVGKEVIIAQTGDVASKWKTWGELAVAVNELQFGSDEAVKAKLDEVASRLEIPTTVVALKNDEGNFTIIKTALQGQIEKLNKEKAGAAEPVTHKVGDISLEGYKFNLKALVGDLKDRAECPVSVETQNKVLSRPVYALLGRIAGNTVLVVTEKLESVSFASSPGKSVAAREGFAFMDQYLGKKPVVVNYVDKSVVDAYMAYNKTSMAQMENMAQTGLKELSKEYQFDSAKLSSSLTVLFTDYMNLVDHSLVGMSDIGTFGWWDKGLKVECSGLPSSTYNMDQPLKFAGAASDPGTVMYLEQSFSSEYVNLSWKFASSMGDVFMDAADTAFSAASLQAMVGQYKPIYEAGRPSLISIGQGYKTLGKQGLGSDVALLLGTPEGQDYVKLSIVADVKSKDKVKEGWTQISKSANEWGGKSLKGMWDMFVPAVQSSPMVVNGQNFDFAETAPLMGVPVPVTFASSLSDKTLAFGVTASYIRTSLESALKAPAAEAKGYAFRLNMSPLAKGIMSVAGDSGAEVAPVIKAASEGVQSIEGGIINRDGKCIYTFYLRTE